jgi:hypothetical protein
LAGLDVGKQREPLVVNSIRAIVDTAAEAIVISSEALEGILQSPKHADAFFSRIAELHLAPKLILFPRNQPQWINSSYAFSVKSFRRSEPFQSAALGFAQSSGSRFSRWIELADAYAFELIARPFTKESVACSVIPEFLRSIGINSSQLRGAEVRRNEAVGPFTIAVAREVLRSIADDRTPLKWLQAEQCKKELARYLREKGLADAGYCGLTTGLARQIEAELQPHNDAFATAVWGQPWAQTFAADVTEEFTPNDFEMRRPDWFAARRLRRAVREMNTIAEEILRDPSLAIEALWNDWRHRSGLVSRV